jgi:TusA-related sulfurtransferase
MSEASASTIKLNIKQMRGPTLEVELDSPATVGDVKAKIAEKHSVPVEEQRLIFAGQVLDTDEKTLEELST